MTTDTWKNCYGESWKFILNDEAFQHPAKYSRALIRRIYEHAIDKSWIREGDTVIDPFGGIGSGALDAMSFKINWVGVELERHFADIATGVDCTGITKADWIRFHNRPEKARYLDGRHWCPRCVAEIARVENGSSNLELFDLPDSAAYVRNSGKIPFVAPHRYVGNIDAWQKKMNFAGAKMLNGDSRRLLEVLREDEDADCCVSSPPFGECETRDRGKPANGIAADMLSRAYTQDKQGTTPGNISNLATTDKGFDAAISSPVYADGAKHTGSSDPKPENVLGGELRFVSYGRSNGQLGSMPEGKFDASISSSPWINNAEGGVRGDKFTDPVAFAKKMSQRDDGKNNRHQVTERARIAQFERENGRVYGNTPGQLGSMRDSGFDAAISSPPYGDQLNQTGGGIYARGEHSDTRAGNQMAYGTTSGQLGVMPEGKFDASISSPPYVKSIHDGNGIDADKLTGGHPGVNSQAFSEGYGKASGQLAAMAEGKFDAAVSSPPYENSMSAKSDGIDWSKNSDGKGGIRDFTKEPAQAMRLNMGKKYGDSIGQIGIESGATFWSAAREIVEETYAVLKPGGHAIWVTKRYVKNGKIVEFSKQWAQLCEAVGFRLVCWHRALLEESHGTQFDLLGEHKENIRAKKSFFRRLIERNGGPKIDWEDVICFIKD